MDICRIANVVRAQKSCDATDGFNSECATLRLLEDVS
jgi:hypothetical protein